jgi:hypothetical protein
MLKIEDPKHLALNSQLLTLKRECFWTSTFNIESWRLRIGCFWPSTFSAES